MLVPPRSPISCCNFGGEGRRAGKELARGLQAKPISEVTKRPGFSLSEVAAQRRRDVTGLRSRRSARLFRLLRSKAASGDPRGVADALLALKFKGHLER